MKYDEIIKLLDAGYTREEILNMSETEKTPEEAPADADLQPSELPEVTQILDEVKNMFAEMRKEITAMNIMNSRQQPNEERTGEDILASIINPSKKDK